MFAVLSPWQSLLNHYFTGIISEKKVDEDDGYHENRRRTVRASVNSDSDSD